MAEPTDLVAVRAALERAHRDEWAVVFGTMVRLTGDWSLAEDCAQDAFVLALRAWQRDGLPRNPGAWLVTAARNRAIDVLRRRRTEQSRVEEAGRLVVPETAEDDERLRLVFTCCHPALPMEGRIALTLRAVMGLTTAEIARLFLVSEATVSQRILRAKQKIAHAGIPYRVPPPGLREERLGGVLAVVYLVFTEAYAPSNGAVVRDDLAGEAIRLARLLVAEHPADAEARGLLALLLLQWSRRAARFDEHWDTVLLEDQDRSAWDRAAIEEGQALARSALSEGDGWYALQAALAAQHARAATAADTDWAMVVHLYDRLLAVRPSPVVRLNRAVAMAMRDGPEAGLAALDDLGRPKELDGSHLLSAVRGELLRRAGRRDEALRATRAARELVRSPAEARLLDRRISELAGTAQPETSLSANRAQAASRKTTT
ncbi:MAG: sigma-70 family RNA polymerase sigma factor [Cellulomonas sp.]|uniref:RNA polymerase sigma factor n=1 Tax=Cellulomonas sp. 73-92 TaxID=1895740 RepID=UPI00092A9980|nr:sigma-70 family RNA polymerase sigma factor [Cellulomonas sp. 73-92]MBN9374443.1 sigma-70 family RNA polymerase sigma factor [Cellulomonas sp.]OJV78907.1 MAG: RNA polymerase subunit sigma-24 [Cellulomonas sp. 73-92]